MNIITLRLIFIFFSLLFFIKNSYSRENHSRKESYQKNNFKIITKNYSEETISFDNKTSFAIVTASALNLRSSPEIKSNIQKILPNGKHVIILSHPFKGWVNVKINDNISGWVSKNYLKFYKPKSLTFLKEREFPKTFLSILEASIIEYMKDIYSKRKLNNNDKLSLVVQDLSTGELLASINSRRIVKSASTIKVPILHAYMIQRSKGLIKETPWHKKLIEEMIRYSSNPSTNSIINSLGGINFVQKLLYETKTYKELKLVEYFPVDGRAYRNKISAADLNMIFKKIWYHIVLNKMDENEIISEEILFLLELPGYSWLKDRIKAKTCFSSKKLIRIWDKTGFVKGANGNAGILQIDSPIGFKAYSIIIFIDRKKFETIDGNSKIWFNNSSIHMRRISEIIFAFFSYRYKRYNSCGHSDLIRYSKLALKSARN